jgi:alanine dehydrogenase
MHTTMEIVERAFLELNDGTAFLPARTAIDVSKNEGIVAIMPAYMEEIGALGAKFVTYFRKNVSDFNKPAIMGTINIFDEHTGEPLAIMDGTYITKMRTGAATGIATKLMARSDSEVATIFGTGSMASMQIWAMVEVNRFKKFNVISKDNREHIYAFCKEMSETMQVPFVHRKDVEEAVGESDVITMVTDSKTPLIKRSWLKDGCHINAIGANSKEDHEVDVKTVLDARITVDSINSCRRIAGDLLIPEATGKWSWDSIIGDLSALVAGKVEGRTSPTQITLFKSVGLAIQDISTALSVYKLAKERGIGTEYDFGM